ncbi:aspartate kinase [Streptomyces sp. NPDC048606]|uniref:aspartate kinase n=1 Tax=Streptomyces sp. NPDC048606 TaxID=3154726 RepID=UPI00344A0C71
MTLVVQKYGGSSVADPAAVRRVARRVVAERERGHAVVVVVSAMGDTTDDLLTLAEQIGARGHGRELDLLLTAGERISMAVLAMAITELGHQARSFTGSQAGVITDAAHGRARITDVTPTRVRTALADGAVAIVAGFQGVCRETGDITTLGRGGSDTTAVALAAALGADTCEIHTDVDGVFTADPRIVPAARRIDRIEPGQMLELAAHGAKILHPRSVEYARRHGMALHVRSSFGDEDGTWITDRAARTGRRTTAGGDMEQPIITGIAHDRNTTKITVEGVATHRAGEAAAVFAALARAGVTIDMSTRGPSAPSAERTDVAITLARTDAAAALTALQRAQDRIGHLAVRRDDRVAKISVVGAGAGSHPGVAATLFSALAATAVDVDMVSTSESRISVLVPLRDLETAVRAVHRALGLDSDRLEAAVHAGTGR